MSASNLPLELLWTTLRNLTTATPFGTEYIDPDSLLAFSLVCRWWRQVALEEKMLWKFLDLSWDTERSKTWADRAGENAPLHFHYIETVHMARVNARVQADLQKQLQLSTDSSISAAPDLGEEQPTNSTERLLRGLEAVQLIANNPEINPRCASLSITCTVVHSFQNTWTRHLAALPNIKTLEIMLEHPPEPPTFGIDHLTILLNGRIFPALESIRAMSISTDYRTLEATLTCLHLVDAPVRTRDALLVRFSALRELSIVRGVATSFDPPPTHANSSIDPLSLFQVPNLKVLYLYDPAPQLLNLLVTRKELPKLTTLVVGRLGTALGLFKIFLRHCNSVTSLRIKDDDDAQLTLFELSQLRRSDNISSTGHMSIERTPFFPNLVELEVFDLPWPYSHLASAAKQSKAPLRPLRLSRKEGSRNFNGLKEFLKVWTSHRSSILERMHLRSMIGDPMRSPEKIPAWVWDSTDVLTVDGQPWDILEKRESLNLAEGE